MSKYTTGDIAKLCSVSVRTVQYYDTRDILKPSELSEGGRRLYSEKDLQKMKIICFLRELDMPINNIGKLFEEENSEEVISILLDEQEKSLKGEMKDMEEKLSKLNELKKAIKTVDNFSVESINDVAYIMENKKKLKRLRIFTVVVGLLMDAFEILSLVYAINTGNWWFFGVGMAVVIALGVVIFQYYYKQTAYICPKCHNVFKPKKAQCFFAPHTPATRRLTCTYCGHKGYCVETYGKDIKYKAAEDKKA